uniref:RBR-type E3 ubiquitin transferase n=1 Tax=Arcella intermedia TaxID=1963864 RepID=A0A6B2L270_9EUKA
MSDDEEYVDYDPYDNDDGDEVAGYFEEIDVNYKDEPNYTVLTVQDIENEQKESIKAVSDILAIPDGTARHLLIWMKWNKDKLIDKFNEGEPSRIYKQTGIKNPSKKKKHKKTDKKASPTSSPAAPVSPTTKTCSICFDDVKTSKMKKISCGHSFCRDCWKFYIRNQVTEGALQVSCPQKGCKVLLEFELIEKFLDAEGKERYRKIMNNEYIQVVNNLRWCPGKNCEKVIKVQLLKDKKVVCSCKTKFCFSCGEFPHEPADCMMVKEWNLKNQKEGDNAKWFATYTKECPKCKAIIHKDGGCQYMRCTNCKHAFCWMCLGAFDHTNHSCNQLKEDGDPTSERAKVNKYIHFFSRYQTHNQSLELENRLKEKAKAMVQEMLANGSNLIEVKYIKEATKALKQCRSTLKYTYIYGYYLPKHVNRSIFEYLQGDLEQQVEKLSQLLESKGQTERLPIINATEYVLQRQKNLLQGLLEGEITGKGGEEEKVYKVQSEYDGWIYNA